MCTQVYRHVCQQYTHTHTHTHKQVCVQTHTHTHICVHVAAIHRFAEAKFQYHKPSDEITTTEIRMRIQESHDVYLSHNNTYVVQPRLSVYTTLYTSRTSTSYIVTVATSRSITSSKPVSGTRLESRTRDTRLPPPPPPPPPAHPPSGSITIQP